MFLSFVSWKNGSEAIPATSLLYVVIIAVVVKTSLIEFKLLFKVYFIYLLFCMHSKFISVKFQVLSQFRVKC